MCKRRSETWAIKVILKFKCTRGVYHHMWVWWGPKQSKNKNLQKGDSSACLLLRSYWEVVVWHVSSWPHIVTQGWSSPNSQPLQTWPHLCQSVLCSFRQIQLFLRCWLHFQAWFFLNILPDSLNVWIAVSQVNTDRQATKSSKTCCSCITNDLPLGFSAAVDCDH